MEKTPWMPDGAPVRKAAWLGEVSAGKMGDNSPYAPSAAILPMFLRKPSLASGQTSMALAASMLIKMTRLTSDFWC